MDVDPSNVDGRLLGERGLCRSLSGAESSERTWLDVRQAVERAQVCQHRALHGRTPPVPGSGSNHVLLYCGGSGFAELVFLFQVRLLNTQTNSVRCRI